VAKKSRGYPCRPGSLVYAHDCEIKYKKPLPSRAGCAEEGVVKTLGDFPVDRAPWFTREILNL
jgi:hypothetical protein